MSRIWLSAGIITGLLAAVFIIMIWLGSRPMTRAGALEWIENHLEKEMKKNNTVTSALVLVDSPELSHKFALGKVHGTPIDSSQAFHIASIGKSFTAVLIGILMEEGKINLDDRIGTYLSQGNLENLFVYKGVDYRNEVTIASLLNHTSGAADYFGDPVIKGKTLLELVIDEPDRFWTPLDLLDFSQNYQKPVGKPGDKFHYSDTGYILLGLLIEKVSGKAFNIMLHEKIFDPLNMNDSCLMFYSEPGNGNRPIAEIWLEGREISAYESVSIDWSGGGIISTLDDLALFVRALNNHEIIGRETLKRFYEFDQTFIRGIKYGSGFMEYHFKDFFPTLGFLPGDMRGHMGVLGTQMFYSKEKDMLVIMSFGSGDYTEGSVMSLIKILSCLGRTEKKETVD